MSHLLPFIFVLFLSACAMPIASSSPEKILPEFAGYWHSSAAKHGVSFDIEIDRDTSTIKNFGVALGTHRPPYLQYTDQFKVIHNDSGKASYLMTKAGRQIENPEWGYDFVIIRHNLNPDQPTSNRILWVESYGCKQLWPLKKTWQHFDAAAIWKKINQDSGPCRFGEHENSSFSTNFYRY